MEVVLDTTAHSLAWCIWLICQHPHIQDKLQEEADSILGDQICMQEYMQHEALTYTSAVFNETMRLKSVAPVMLVETIDDIEVDGIQLVKGSKIVLLTRASGMKDAYTIIRSIASDAKASYDL